MPANLPSLLFASLLLVGCAQSTGDRPSPGDNSVGSEIECLPYIAGTLTASAERVVSGRPVTLTWSAPRIPNCSTIDLFIHDITLSRRTPVSESGSLAFTPLFATRYELEARMDSVEKTLGTAVVKVSLPKVVYIRGNDYEWRQLLMWAVRTPGTTVRLMPEVDMDLTHAVSFEQDLGEDPSPLDRAVLTPFILVAAGVTLTGDRVPGEEALGDAPAPGGTHAPIGSTAPPTTTYPDAIIPGRGGLRLGPRLFRTKDNGGSGQFNLRCYGENCADDVKFSGFRLIGPEYDITDAVSATGINALAARRLEISNMEFAGWSTQAINGGDGDDDKKGPDRITDPRRPNYDLDSNRAHIHDNFFHHNQHDELGYGTNASGLYALIEHNVFDYNRHAIAGGAGAGSGYDARHNLILKGGGHTNFGPGLVDTHQVDVHGTESCWWIDHSCGDAGTYWMILGNAFQYSRDSGVAIRGKPAIRATIKENVFPYEDESDAIELQTYTNVTVGFNDYQHDSYAHYAVCDFDGDGRDDLFLATRRNWWYSSAAKMQWVFLREASEDLRVMAVGYFDGDRKCDLIKRSGQLLSLSSGGKDVFRILPGSVDAPWSELRFVDMDGNGITDIFMRRDDGRWSVRAPSSDQWQDINVSGAPIASLRFARLTPSPGRQPNPECGNKMDVIHLAAGKLEYSCDGIDTWKPLNLDYGERDVLLFGDLDGNGQDDILRYTPLTLNLPPKWYVAWSGAPTWSPLPPLEAQLTNVTAGLDASLRKRTYFGAFNEKPGLDLLFLDGDRYGNLYAHPATAIQNRYSLYQY